MEQIKNTNLVSLEELEFEREKRTIEFRDAENELKRITIFNPTEEEIDELSTIGMRYAKIEDGEIKSLDIPQSVMWSEIIKMLTDIELPDDQETINRIINNPNMLLKEIILEITDIYVRVMSLLKKAIECGNTVKDIAGITDEKLIKLIELQSKQKELEVQLEKEKQESQKIENEKIQEQNKLLENYETRDLSKPKEEVIVEPKKKQRGRPKKEKKVEQ